MAALVVLQLPNGIRNRAKTCQAYVPHLFSGLILVSSPSLKEDCQHSCPVATSGHRNQGLKRVALSSPKQTKIARNNSLSLSLCLSRFFDYTTAVNTRVTLSADHTLNISDPSDAATTSMLHSIISFD